jgi:transcriptional regulator with PAS, ATPase and Fis domain
MKNIIERLVVLSPEGMLQMDEGFSINPLKPSSGATEHSQSLKSIRSDAERKHIQAVLSACDFDYNKASEILEISSRQLYNKCKTYGIRK